VQPDDEEAIQTVAEDEFAAHFQREVAPSLMVTTNRRPSARMFEFLTNLFETLPNATFYARRAYNVRLCRRQHKKAHTLLLTHQWPSPDLHRLHR
jgi:hypothetical protein